MSSVAQEEQIPQDAFSVSCARFHANMGIGAALGVGVSLLLCYAYSLTVAHAFLGLCSVLLICSAAYCPLPIYLHESNRIELREAALTILWLFFLDLFIPIPVEASARAAFPLQDATMVRIDAWFGVNVAAVAAWSHDHAFGRALNWCYSLLNPFLVVAIFVPAFLGQWRKGREFLIANVIAVCVGISAFAFLPVIGPWYGEHYTPSLMQHYCQQTLMGLRANGDYGFRDDSSGIVSFPSFHTIWAVLSSYALWGFRFLRWPSVICAVLIILSTMTTGWHYFADVLGGLILAFVSIEIATHFSIGDKQPPSTDTSAQIVMEKSANPA